MAVFMAAVLMFIAIEAPWLRKSALTMSSKPLRNTAIVLRISLKLRCDNFKRSPRCRSRGSEFVGFGFILPIRHVLG